MNSDSQFNTDIEIAAIKKVLQVFENRSNEIVKTLTAEINAAQNKQQASAKRHSNELYAEIAKMYTKGLISGNETAVKYVDGKLKEQQKNKLEEEIRIAKYISTLSAEERKKDNAILKKELDIIKARESGDKDRIDAASKELEVLKLEKKILAERNSGNDYEADILAKELAIIKLRQNGNDKEAKQKAKELAIQKKRDKQKAAKKEKQENPSDYEFGDLFKEQFKDLIEAIEDPKDHAEKTMEQNLINTMKGVGAAIQEGLNAINNSISSYAKYQTGINSRLQGVSSYSQIVKTLDKVAYSPLLSAESLYENVATLVGQGLVTNVEQRAMFETVKEGIAQTFDVTSDSLKRIIRVQQTDSTAARLGMEAYLTKFLNVYVENTEYLQSTFDTVSASLLEASSLMYLANKAGGAAQSAELEYIVQKWLGTLVGIGFSDASAQAIAEGIGQIGSGDVEGVGSNNIQNLLIMAANRANLSYAEMLNDGLDAKQANDLFKGVVEYLQEISTTGTNVVKNQLSNIFGVTVSDLVAVSNLSADSLKTVHSDMLSYQNMYGELEYQFDQLTSRIGISNILENLFANFTYQTGQGIGSNPVLYSMWKITDMIQGVTNGKGINIPFITAFGSGIGLETSVENLIKLGIVGISTLGGIGSIIGGLSSVANGSMLLDKLKVSEANAIVKSFGGSSLSSSGRTSGSTTSESTYVGNTAGDDYYESTINAANEEPEKELEQKQKEYEDPVVKYYEEELQLPSRMDQFTELFTEKIDQIIAQQLISSSSIDESILKIITLLTPPEPEVPEDATSAESDAGQQEEAQVAGSNASSAMADAAASANQAAAEMEATLNDNSTTSASTAGQSSAKPVGGTSNLQGATTISSNNDLSEIIPNSTQSSSKIDAKEAALEDKNNIKEYVNAIILNDNQNISTISNEIIKFREVITSSISTAATLLDESIKTIPTRVDIEETVANAVNNEFNQVESNYLTAFDRYQNDQGLSNNSITSTYVDTDSDYLVEIEFGTGFKMLVQTVQDIFTFLTKERTSNISSGSISGFTQYTFE